MNNNELNQKDWALILGVPTVVMLLIKLTGIITMPWWLVICTPMFVVIILSTIAFIVMVLMSRHE